MRTTIIILLSFLLISCDFTGRTTTPQQERKQQKHIPDYYEENNNNKVDSTKKDGTNTPTVILTGIDDNTLEKDSILRNNRTVTDDLQEEIEQLKLKIQVLHKQTNLNNLTRSTHIVKNEEVVEKYLYEMYVKELQALKKAHKSEDVLSEKFKKFFTVDYCDDRVLKWLDNFASKRIRSDARRMHLNYEKVANEDATGKQIIYHK